MAGESKVLISGSSKDSIPGVPRALLCLLVAAILQKDWDGVFHQSFMPEEPLGLLPWAPAKRMFAKH